MDGYWKVYFELNGFSLQETVDYIKKQFGDLEISLWYYHPSGKRGKGPHIHGLVKDYPKSDDSFRSYLKAKFNIKGSQLGVSNTFRRGTKMSQETIPGYICYMTKGIHEPSYNKGFDKEYLDARKDDYKFMYGETIISNEVIAITKKVDRKTQWDYVIEAEDILWGPEDIDKEISKKEIWEAVVKVLNNNKKAPHDDLVIKIHQAIQTRSIMYRDASWNRVKNRL